MKDIETYEDELVEILVPSVIKQFNLKYNEIKVRIRIIISYVRTCMNMNDFICRW